MGRIYPTPENLIGTPVGDLFDMRLNAEIIADITNVSLSAISKWGTGANLPAQKAQSLAAAYLKGQKSVPTPPEPPANLTLITKAQVATDESIDSHSLLLTVPTAKLNKVLNMITFFGLKSQNLDD